MNNDTKAKLDDDKISCEITPATEVSTEITAKDDDDIMPTCDAEKSQGADTTTCETPSNITEEQPATSLHDDEKASKEENEVGKVDVCGSAYGRIFQ